MGRAHCQIVITANFPPFSLDRTFAGRFRYEIELEQLRFSFRETGEEDVRFWLLPEAALSALLVLPHCGQLLIQLVRFASAPGVDILSDRYS